ncbi:MAG: tripartite tricarboxylate transporter TctB family protein [Lachnospiraceae bacterium]|nr:tripartite tricarboxylate transporter TctB family protein [Lachnospiraceae bacterium]
MFLRKYGDLITSVFFLIFGIWLILYARTFPESAIVSIGPDFMPTTIGLLMAVLAAILLVQSIMALKKPAEIKADEDAPEYKRVIESLVLSLAYVFLLQPVGFIISTLVYLFAQIFVLAPEVNRTKKDLIIFAVVDVVFTFIVFFLFRYGFKIVLPAGIFTINL